MRSNVSLGSDVRVSHVMTLAEILEWDALQTLPKKISPEDIQKIIELRDVTKAIIQLRDDARKRCADLKLLDPELKTDDVNAPLDKKSYDSAVQLITTLQDIIDPRYIRQLPSKIFDASGTQTGSGSCYLYHPSFHPSHPRPWHPHYNPWFEVTVSDQGKKRRLCWKVNRGDLPCNNIVTEKIELSDTHHPSASELHSLLFIIAEDPEAVLGRELG